MSAVATRSDLASDLEDFLAEHPGETTYAIARGVRVRRQIATKALEEDDRFVEVPPSPPQKSNARCWKLASDAGAHDEWARNGDGTGTGRADSEGLDSAFEPVDDSLTPPPASCADPEMHASWGAHYISSYGSRCIRCDGPKPPPLTDEEYVAGEGGEDRRHAYEAERHRRLVEAWRRASPEKREIFRRAIREQMRALGLG